MLRPRQKIPDKEGDICRIKQRDGSVSVFYAAAFGTNAVKCGQLYWKLQCSNEVEYKQKRDQKLEPSPEPSPEQQNRDRDRKRKLEQQREKQEEKSNIKLSTGYFVNVNPIGLDRTIMFGITPSVLNPIPFGVTANINLNTDSEKCDYKTDDASEISTLNIPLEDDVSPSGVQLDKCWDFIQSLPRYVSSIYIHCKNGQYRSGAVVIAIVARLKGWSINYTKKRIEALWVEQRDLKKYSARIRQMGLPQTKNVCEWVKTNSDGIIHEPPQPFNVCLFYAPEDQYYEFSNYWQVEPILFNGIHYTNAESAYQSFKFQGPKSKVKEYQLLIGAARTANIARRLGRQELKYGYNTKVTLLATKNPKGDSKWIGKTVNEVVQFFKDGGVTLNPKWEEMKLEIMIDILLTKFKNCRKAEEKLKSVPENTLIVEHSPRDEFWGDWGNEWAATDQHGRNYLGRIITAIRYKLFSSKKDIPNRLACAIGKSIIENVHKKHVPHQCTTNGKT